MATYSVPSSFSIPQIYNITLDAVNYTLTVFYQYYAARFYFTITDNYGNIIVTKPLISSDYNINNLYGYFTSELFYSAIDQVIETT